MKKGCRKIFALLLLVPVLLAVVLMAGYYQLRQFSVSPMASLPQQEAYLLVERGDSFRTMLGKLRQAGVREGQDWQWMLLAKLDGVAGKMQAGEYALAATLTPRQLLGNMRQGRVVSHYFTLVEGWNMRDVRHALARAPHLQQQGAKMSDAELMAAIGQPGEHPEGRFLPDTYQYRRHESDLDILKRAHAAMSKTLDEVWQTRAPGLPLKTPYELLTLASIVEKETARADERAEIAGVFVRRLHNGMRLETDPTIIYGLGDAWNGDLTWAHLRTDGPYNTRTRAGLPPTPIAMPGRDALKAAAHPAEGVALFFVAMGDGSGRSRFARTYAEHQKNVSLYLQARRAAGASGGKEEVGNQHKEQQ